MSTVSEICSKDFKKVKNLCKGLFAKNVVSISLKLDTLEDKPSCLDYDEDDEPEFDEAFNYSLKSMVIELPNNSIIELDKFNKIHLKDCENLNPVHFLQSNNIYNLFNKLNLLLNKTIAPCAKDWYYENTSCVPCVYVLYGELRLHKTEDATIEIELVQDPDTFIEWD